MRRTSTVLFCLAAICVTEMLMAQDDTLLPVFPVEESRPADLEPLAQPTPPTTEVFPGPDANLGLGQSAFGGGGRSRRGFSSLMFGRGAGESKEEARLQERIEEATKYTTSVLTEEAERATTELEAAVTELFELRAKERLKQIEELEQRIAKLRDQMERREEKKSEIIQLQVQTYINQANGLGF